MSTGSALHRRGLWRVLDQLHEIVAHHDLAGGRGDIAADHELLRARGSLAFQGALDVLQPIAEASHQILSGFRPRRIEQFGIGEQVVRGRQRLERVARDEIELPLALRRHARHARPGLLPPIGVVAVAVRQHVEGPLCPGLALEACVALRRRQSLAGTRLEREIPVVHRLGEAILHDLGLFGGFLRDVQIPIPPRVHIHIGREPAGDRRELFPKHAAHVCNVIGRLRSDHSLG